MQGRGWHYVVVGMLAGLGVIACSSGSAAAEGFQPISPSVRSALLKQARQTARADGDHHPYDIRAARTTEGEAARLRHDNGSSAFEAEVIYLVAMRGHFQCNTCSPPPGARIKPAAVITLDITVGTLQRTGFSFGGPYPDLKKAGSVVWLATGRRGGASGFGLVALDGT